MGILKKATPSVDQIMTSFTKTLEQLDTVMVAKTEEAVAEQDAARAAEARSAAATHEAGRAARIASKINELIS